MATIEHETPLMEVLRGSVLEAKPDRLSFHHIELRDQALHAVERAHAAVQRLQELEQGGTQMSLSPRLTEVRSVAAELRALELRLDRVYV